MNRRGFWFGLAGIVLVGAALRALPLVAAPLWSDEALTPLIALHAPFDLARYPLDPTPPLFYWLQALLVPATTLPPLMRWPALVAGIAAIPLFAAVGNTLGGRKAGLAAALLAALSPVLIDYSHEARAYALLVSLLAATLLFALKALEPGARRRDTGLFVLFGVLSLYTHVVAAFLVFPMATVLAWQGRKRGAAPGWAVAIVVLMAAYAPEALRTVRVARRSPSFSWLQQASPGDALALVGQVGTGLGGLLGLAALIALGVLAVARRAAIAEALRERQGAIWLLAIGLAEPLVLYGAGLVGKPMLMPRAALPMLVGLIPLAALVLTRAGKGQAIALVATAAVIAGGLAHDGLARPKEDWEGAAQVVLSTRPRFVIVCPQWQAPALLAALRSEGEWRPTLVVDTARGPTVVPPDGAWVPTFYDALYWDDTANMRRADPKPAGVTSIPAGEGLALTGSCQYPDRVAAWARPVSRETVWESNSQPPVANMTIERWTWTAPIPARTVAP